jgi:acetylglutamate kinase
VVKVGGAILRDELDALVSSLAFLQQVGLTPIVVHGAGPQLDEEMAAAGHRQEDRRRPALHRSAGAVVVRRVAQQEKPAPGRSPAGAGRARDLGHLGVFEAELLDQAKYGLVGKVVRCTRLRSWRRSRCARSR